MRKHLTSSFLLLTASPSDVITTRVHVTGIDVVAAAYGIFYLLSMVVAGDGLSQSRGVTRPGAVNWNEPDWRRDYADAASERASDRRGRISIHETLARCARSLRRAIEPRAPPRCPSVCLSRCQSARNVPPPPAPTSSLVPFPFCRCLGARRGTRASWDVPS